MKKEFLECGCVCNAHGVRGVLRVESWCDSPKVLAAQKRIYLAEKDGGYAERKILGASVSGAAVLLTVEGIETREAAISMKNAVLYLRREDIPLPKGAVFIADMIGLSVIDANSGRVYGGITDVVDVPRGRLYTVKTASGDVLYPSGEQFVKEIDPEKGVFITPIPGFFEDDAV